MSTPFISCLQPDKLNGYDGTRSHDHEASRFPKTLLDAMEVRESVFASQPHKHTDPDDARSCHWVVYASVNKMVAYELRDELGNVLRPAQSTTRSTPIGTIRLVPFPHRPHPRPGGRYEHGCLVNGNREEFLDAGPVGAVIRTDRPTSFHDGKEPYVKLDRLAIVEHHRDEGLSGLLIQAVHSWLQSNPSYFDPSITELGLEQTGASNEADIPKWSGLVCVHAAKDAADAWRRWGFEVDQEMGSWWDDGVPFVGMFKRMQITPREVRI